MSVARAPRRPGLPPVHGLEASHQKLVDGVRERLELIAGERGAKIDLLPTTGATTDQIAATLNKLLTLLQQ